MWGSVGGGYTFHGNVFLVHYSFVYNINQRISSHEVSSLKNDLWPRSCWLGEGHFGQRKNNLVLEYSHNFINTINCLYLTVIKTQNENLLFLVVL